MDILTYIIALIKFRKEIGIDGLGTFYKQKTPGRYDAATHMFLPPSYTLSFTNAVNETNNLVAFISKKRQISLDTASYFISQFVTEIQKELANTGEYELQDFGKLSTNNGELKFYPLNEVNAGFDFFALPPVTSEIPKIANEENNEVIIDQRQLQHQVSNVSIIEAVEKQLFEEERAAADEETDALKVNLIDTSEKGEASQTDEHKEDRIIAENRAEEENPDSFPEIETPEQLEKEFNNDQPTPNFSATADNPDHRTANEVDEQEVFDEIADLSNTTAANIKSNDLQNDWNFNNQQEEIEDINIAEEETPAPAEKPASIIQEIDSEPKKYDFHLQGGTVTEKPIVDITAPTKDWEFNDAAEHALVTNEVEQLEAVEDEKKGVPTYLKGLLVALVLAVAVVILYVVNPNIFKAFVKNDINPDTKIAVPVAQANALKTQADSLSFADSIMNNAEKVGLKVDPVKDTLNVTTTTKPVTTITYEVIAAALTTKEATPFIAKLKRKGIAANIVEDMPGRLKKVSIGSFNNPDSAQKYAAYYRKTLKNEQIYSIAVKHK